MRLLLRYALVLTSMFVLAVAYSTETKPPVQQSLAVAISAPASVKAGSPAKLTITATNTSDREVAYYVGPAELYHIYVRDATGAFAPDTAEGIRKHPWSPHRTGGGGVFSGPSFRFHVGPGEKQETEVDITKEYNLTKPGKYTVYVERPDPENKGQWLKSNTITITVTP